MASLNPYGWGDRLQNLSYAQFMAEAGAHLELMVEQSGLMEVRDLGDLLGSIASQYDDFVQENYKDQRTDARFYVQEVRRGSLIVEFVASSIGLMDQVLIMKQFFGLTKDKVLAFRDGDKELKITSARRTQMADMVRSVANADEGSITLAYKEKNADGSEAALVINKGDANAILSRAIRETITDSPEAPPLDDTSGPYKRVLMRFWQHNLKSDVAEKSRTGHRVIIADLDKKPKTLTYASELAAQKLSAILDEQPYKHMLFDVTVAPRYDGGKLRAYTLIELHDWFEDEEDDSPPLIEG